MIWKQILQLTTPEKLQFALPEAYYKMWDFSCWKIKITIHKNILVTSLSQKDAMYIMSAT